jgi:hypothetical protein
MAATLECTIESAGWIALAPVEMFGQGALGITQRARHGKGQIPPLDRPLFRDGEVGSREAQSVAPDLGIVGSQVPNDVVGGPVAAMNHSKILPWIIHVVTNYLIW